MLPFKLGDKIKYRIGFKVFANGQDVNPIQSPELEKELVYTVFESAQMAATVMGVVAVAITLF